MVLIWEHTSYDEGPHLGLFSCQMRTRQQPDNLEVEDVEPDNQRSNVNRLRFTWLSSDTGDHVVVINSRHVALPGDEWRRRSYFHHTGYPGGATWTMAWELHEKDPTMVTTYIIT
ncbi:54S ribosomal protein L13 [Homalodisca vitripennis]|nr:54S ribosomal protein L13 [Homalodisca vitripennis]